MSRDKLRKEIINIVDETLSNRDYSAAFEDDPEGLRSDLYDIVMDVLIKKQPEIEFTREFIFNVINRRMGYRWNIPPESA